MKSTLRQSRKLTVLSALSVLILLSLSQCKSQTKTPSPDSSASTTADTPSDQLSVPQKALVTFLVTIPENTPLGHAIQFILLDDVTGLPYNPQNYNMEALDAAHYRLSVYAPIGSVLKYRYARVGDIFTQEYTADGKPVRYRLYYVDGVGTVEDIVSRWSDTPLITTTGRLIGEVLDAENGMPLPNIMVEAGGLTAYTASNGSFYIQGLPPGKHNITCFALNGSYKPFKQDAIIAPDAATPAAIHLQRSLFAEVKFIVSVPIDTVPGAPVRLAGSLYQLGNTFTNLAGGISAPSYRLPTMQLLADGRYSYSVVLPIGAVIEYKYTLGDGLWNAEHNPDGSFRLRQVFIPPDTKNLVFEDTVVTWQAGPSAPVWFDYTFPPNAPKNEQVYIQLSLFGWTEPIPIWQAESGNRWGYLLSSPTNISGGIDYRFCRNAQCGNTPGIAVDITDPAYHLDFDKKGSPIQTGSVEKWQFLEQLPSQITVLSDVVRPRGDQFLASIEFSPRYHVSWLPYMPAAYGTLQNMYVNHVTLTPTWTVTHVNPPNLALSPETDISWFDLSALIRNAQNGNLRVSLYPQLYFSLEPDNWWLAAPRDKTWWHIWFERYRTFVLHFADLAHRNNIDSIVLGGDWIAPALPEGALRDGSPSGVPQNADDIWRSILNDVRVHYAGKIGWVLVYPRDLDNPPTFIENVDIIHIAWTPALTEQSGTSPAQMKIRAGELIDAEILPFYMRYEKPIILDIAYPSAHGATTGCITGEANSCISLDAFVPPAPTPNGVQIDLSEQADAYNAILAAVNERAWIRGVNIQGYYPPAVLHDSSTSVNGKPAAQVIWYWFRGFLGKQ